MIKVNEIKFRAWDKDDKVMRSWEELILEKESGNDYWFVGHKESEVVTRYHHEQVLQQYTGLKDKNGTEIYEGDILEGVHHELTYHTSHKEKIKGEVYYTNRGTWDCESFLLGDLNETCEVIGNIYNN